MMTGAPLFTDLFSGCKDARKALLFVKLQNVFYTEPNTIDILGTGEPRPHLLIQFWDADR